jgi:hypothetical protein
VPSVRSKRGDLGTAKPKTWLPLCQDMGYEIA